jgi:hypothetical protein
VHALQVGSAKDEKRAQCSSWAVTNKACCKNAKNVIKSWARGVKKVRTEAQTCPPSSTTRNEMLTKQVFVVLNGRTALHAFALMATPALEGLDPAIEEEMPFAANEDDFAEQGAEGEFGDSAEATTEQPARRKRYRPSVCANTDESSGVTQNRSRYRYGIWAGLVG